MENEFEFEFEVILLKIYKVERTYSHKSTENASFCVFGTFFMELSSGKEKGINTKKAYWNNKNN